MNKFLVVLLILIIQISSKVVHYHYHFGNVSGKTRAEKAKAAKAAKEAWMQKLDVHYGCMEQCYEANKDESNKDQTCKTECPFPKKTK
jgi:hypothetical protein